jgi:hypothetical protein
MWAGDFAAALPHLLPVDHVLRARAHAHLGQLDKAKKEIEAACKVGAGIEDPLVRAEVREITCLFLARGLPAPWPAPARDASDDPDYLKLSREGDFAAARAKLAKSQWIARVRAEPLPMWDGQRVGHLVVDSYHTGIGDFFQFGRYVGLARARCSRLSIVVDPSLVVIAKRCLPVDDVVRKGCEWPLFEIADAFVPLGPIIISEALGVTYATPMQIAPVADSVPDLGPGFHVGLRWSTSASDSGMRTVRFDSLGPLRSLAGATFHSLQAGVYVDRSGQTSVDPHHGAESWAQRHDLRAWDDTVSLIAALDAVIAVDGSLAHLAASMGKRVHLILTEYEDWRWGTGGETTPWYPTMTIYRGDIDESVKRIRDRLASEALQAAA